MIVERANFLFVKQVRIILAENKNKILYTIKKIWRIRNTYFFAYFSDNFYQFLVNFSRYYPKNLLEKYSTVD